MINYKNLLSTLFLLLLFRQISFAQPGCPNVEAGNNVTLSCSTPCTNLTASCLATGATTTYTASSIAYNPPYAFNTGTAILVHIDDTWSSVINLPFSFCFYGNAYNQIVAGSNGVISFNLAYAGGYCQWPFSATCPSSSIPINAIFGVYHDIDPSVSGQMYYAILGSYPCRTFLVSWNEVAMYSSSCNYLKATHMIVLYESTNVIEVYIKKKPLCTSWNSGNALVGIQDAAGTNGIAAPGRNTSQWTANNEAWRFTPAGNPNYTLTWWQGGTQIGTGPTVNVCPTSATTYTAQVIYDCCVGNDVTVTDNVTVNVDASSTVSVTPMASSICNGGSTTFNASGGSSYSWSPGTGLNTTTGPTVTATPSETTTYTLTGVSGNGCVSQIPVTVTVNPNPVPYITPSSPAICPGGSVVLTGNGANSYTWSPGSGLSCTSCSGPTATLTQNATYYVVGTSAEGCTGTTSVTVTVNPNPNVTINPTSAAICNGNSVPLTANGASSYVWAPPTGLSCTSCPNPTANPTTQTTYTITGTSAAGCTGSTTVTVSINPNPVLTILPANPVICFGDSITMTGNGATNYTWSPSTGLSSTSGTSINASPPQTTTYSVNGTSGAGCTASTTFMLTVNPIPTSDFTVSAPNCIGNTASINYTGTASSGASYSWNFSGGSASPGTGQGPHQLTWSSPGSYDVTLTVTENNCVSLQTTHTVLVSDISTNSPIHTNVICYGENNGTATVYPINGSNPYSYHWSTSPSQTTQTASNLIIGTYYVTITDNVGCITYDTVQVFQPPLLGINVTYENEGCSNSCDGSVSVTVNGGIQPYQYVWTGSSQHTPEIDNLCVGNYSVTATDSNNCTISGSATISTNFPIHADAIVDSKTILLQNTITFYFTGTGATNFFWDFGDGTTTNVVNPSHVYPAEGVYTVKLVVTSGPPDFCADSFYTFIEVILPSKIEIPNIFTPNGDNANETFKVKSDGLKSEEMLIYNRWGKKVFEWNEVGGEWNGYNESGQQEADGIYYYIYVAKGNDKKDFRFNGTVTLMR